MKRYIEKRVDSVTILAKEGSLNVHHNLDIHEDFGILPTQ